MSNVAAAQRTMLAALIGPGYGVMQAIDALAPHVLHADGRPVNIGVGQASRDCVAADVYPLSDVTSMGQTMQGITEQPIGRVYLDLTNGTAFMLPDDAFNGR